LLSTRNHSKKWNPTSTHPRGLFQNLASCQNLLGLRQLFKPFELLPQQQPFAVQVVEWFDLVAT